MKIDDGFERRLRSEFAHRIEDGSLPEPIRRVIGDQYPALRMRLAAQPSAPFDLSGLDEQARIRTVVNAFGSPSLLIRNHSFERATSQTWTDILEPRRTALEEVIPAVGKIEVMHHPSKSWLGTGVLVAPTVVVTNRHVALKMAEESAQGFKFSPGLGGQAIAARIDFREEDGVTASAEFDLVDVLSVANAKGPDLAFLRVRTHPNLPNPAELGGVLESNDAVAAVGYTAEEPGLIPEVQEILSALFGAIYDVKRFAPGRVLRADAQQVAHDCSTQGGNSGSAILDIETALVAGIHFKGGITENQAVPAAVVRTLLNQLP